MTDWKPIKTAPKDGSDFLGYTKHGDCHVIFYDERLLAPSHCWHKADGLAYHCDLFTHWMTLPPPPRPCDSER